LPQFLRFPGNAAIIEIGDAQVKQYIQKQGETEKGEVKSVTICTYHILYRPVNAKNPERFYQQVQEQYKGEICDKFSLHLKNKDTGSKRYLIYKLYFCFNISTV
jgi:hypothetical protein